MKKDGLSGRAERRSQQRVGLRCEITMRRDGGNNYRVVLRDLSQTGCKVEYVERPRLLEGIWVKFDHLEALHAVVSWIEPPLAGIQFERAIHPAVFDRLVKDLSAAKRPF